jgi:hypothetical protein
VVERSSRLIRKHLSMLEMLAVENTSLLWTLVNCRSKNS